MRNNWFLFQMMDNLRAAEVGLFELIENHNSYKSNIMLFKTEIS